MGSDWDEFWRRILRFSWFGHQSLFDLVPTFLVRGMTGHFASVDNVLLLLGLVEIFSKNLRRTSSPFWLS
jgi:hypothetical protein